MLDRSMPSEFPLTLLGQIIWEDRYGLKNEQGALIEKSILDTFRRNAKAMASKESNSAYWENEFYKMLALGFFSPAGRILAHSGTHYSQLLNCFVLPFRKDSLEEIMHTAGDMAVVQKHGGGTGFNYTRLRPSGSFIKGVNGRSCGVIGFVNMMSTTSEVIEQGGSRRGANLGLLEVWHPDVWEFISYKTNHNWDHMLEFMEVKDQERWQAFKFENLYKWQMYNVSIGVTDEFLDAVKKDLDWRMYWKDTDWQLYTVVFKKYIDKDTYAEKRFEVTADCDATAKWKVKKLVPFPSAKDSFIVESKRNVKARELWNRICQNAWADGCPGLLNLSTIRRMHNLEYANPVESTNPCLLGSSLLLTDMGLQQIGGLEGITVNIWNGSSWVPSEVFCSGTKPVYEMRLSNGQVLRGTADHRVFAEGAEVHLSDTIGKMVDRMTGSDWVGISWDRDDTTLICAGFVFGDGNFHKASGRYKYVHIGEDDGDVQSLFYNLGEDLEEAGRSDKRLLSSKFAHAVCDSLYFPGVPLPERALPQRILSLPPRQIRLFLKGLFSANGSVLKNGRVTYKTSCKTLVEQLQILLMALGIKNYVTTNKAHDVEFSNGTYSCKESYDLNITSDELTLFRDQIGFVQGYKNVRLKEICAEPRGRGLVPKVIEISYLGEEKVYDFTEPDRHFGFVNGLKVHNCGEQPLPSLACCLLGSLNLSTFVVDGSIDYESLAYAVKTSVRFMDNVIDNCDFPVPGMKEMETSERRIGLGTMGVHDMLMKMHLGYDTDAGRNMVEEVLAYIRNEAYKASIELSKERGPFPLFDKEKYLQSGFVKTLPQEIIDLIVQFGIRNGTILSQAPTGCLVGGTLVPLSSGFKPIDQVSVNRSDKWVKLNPRTTQVISDFGKTGVISFFNNGLSETVGIKTNKGYTIEGTPDHKVRVMSAGNGYSWKMLKDLSIGDKVVLKKGFIQDKVTWLKPDIAYLLGYYMADGWWSSCEINPETKSRGYRLYFSLNPMDPSFNIFIKNKILSTWGGTYKITPDRIIPRYNKKGQMIRYEISNAKLFRWFEKYNSLKDGAVNAYIPDIVLGSSTECISQFIKGFFDGDGCFQQKKKNISFKTVSSKIAHQLQTTLLGLGVPSSVYIGKKPSHDVFIEGRKIQSFRIPYTVSVDRGYTERLCQLMGVNAPFDFVRRTEERVPIFHHEIYEYGLYPLKGDTAEPFLTIGTYKHKVPKDEWNWFVQNDLMVDGVRSIEIFNEPKETFDLSVADVTHTYVANGFVTHNTIGTMFNVSTGCEPWFSLKMQRNTRLGSYEDGCQTYLDWEKKNSGKPVPDYFKTAEKISPEDHIKMLCVFTKYNDSATSKCVAKGTLISTNMGTIPIENFSTPSPIIPDTFNTPNAQYTVMDENGHLQKVESHYYGGEKHCFKIRFDNGFVLTAADTHLLKTGSGWKSFKDLKVGDKVLYRTNGLPDNTKYVPVVQPVFNGVTNEHSLNFPKVYDEKFTRQGLIEKCGFDVDLNLRYVSITDKEDAGFQPVYDIEVANSHSYLINGVVSHNTVNLPNDATADLVKDAFNMAMENGVKGITVFRDGCKDGVLVRKEPEKAQDVQDDDEEEEDDDLTPGVSNSGDTRQNPKKRGSRTVGATTRISMQTHNMYVTVNRNADNHLVEVFATVGESKSPKTHHTSGIEDSWAEAVAKLISLALRAGVEPQSIVRNLKNIPSDKPVFTTVGDLDHSELLPSPPHAIGRVIEEELKYQITNTNKIQMQDQQPKEGARCANCGSTNLWFRTPTCYECRDCSVSSCSG